MSPPDARERRHARRRCPDTLRRRTESSADAARVLTVDFAADELARRRPAWRSPRCPARLLRPGILQLSHSVHSPRRTLRRAARPRTPGRAGHCAEFRFDLRFELQRRAAICSTWRRRARRSALLLPNTIHTVPCASTATPEMSSSSTSSSGSLPLFALEQVALVDFFAVGRELVQVVAFARVPRPASSAAHHVHVAVRRVGRRCPSHRPRSPRANRP